MEDMYSKAVNRLVEQVPHVKYVSLTAEYEYSADDATDELELKTELMQIKQWMVIITSEFFKHQIQILEFELFASFGFDDNIPLRQFINETFGQDYNLDLEFCSLGFTCDIKLPLYFGGGNFLLSAELSDHISRRPSGRKSNQRLSCEQYGYEENAAIHHLQAYEIDANTLDLSVFQSKTTFFLDLPVVQADRKQIKRFYDESIRNFRRVLPKVKKVKLKAQTYFFSPKNSSSEAELKTQLRYLKRWAQIVVDSFQQEDLKVQSFDLTATLGFEHTIPLDRLFHSAFNQPDAEIEPFMNRNFYSLQIPLDGSSVRLQAELLLNGGLGNGSPRSENSTKFFTLRQLLAAHTQ